MGVYSQEIVFDKVDGNNERRVETTMKSFTHWTNDEEIMYGMEAKEKFGKIAYRLAMQFKSKKKIRLDTYMRLLLKTKAGTIIELKCSQGGRDDTGELYDPVSMIYEYKVKGYYDITDEQIIKITSEGLEKIRMELYDRDINEKYSASRNAGAYIAYSYNALNRRIEERRSFPDDF